MLIGDLDLERAFRDPAYLRRVSTFLDGAPGASTVTGETGPRDHGADPGTSAKTAPPRERRLEAGAE